MLGGHITRGNMVWRKLEPEELRIGDIVTINDTVRGDVFDNKKGIVRGVAFWTEQSFMDWKGGELCYSLSYDKPFPQVTVEVEGYSLLTADANDFIEGRIQFDHRPNVPETKQVIGVRWGGEIILSEANGE